MRALFIRTAALTALLVACGEDEPTAPKANKPTVAATAKTAEAAPAAVTEVVRSYSPVGKRDPFQSYLAELRNTNSSETARRQEATEEYDLEQYNLTGVVTGTSQPRALVEDPSGKGHVVQIGSRIGKNSGIITRITSTGIVVTQETRAPTGEKVRIPITIPLPQPELEMGKGQ